MWEKIYPPHRILASEFLDQEGQVAAAVGLKRGIDGSPPRWSFPSSVRFFTVWTLVHSNIKVSKVIILSYI